MKTKFFAFAAAGLLPAVVMAQTNITISGVIDAGIEHVNHLAPGNDTITRMISGGTYGSRLSFRGAEDLGGGLKAIFLLENGFDIDTGAALQNGRIFGRSAFVGLENRVGRITFGRLYTTLYDWAVQYDPLGPGRYSSPLIDAAYAARVDNAVKAVGKFGPADVGAYYSLGAETVDAARVGRQYGFYATYVWSALSVGVSFDSQAGATVPTQQDTVERSSLGVRYDLGFAKLYSGFTYRKNDLVVKPTALNQYWVAVTAPLGPNLALAAAYYATDFRNDGHNPKAVSTILTYSMSKRTALYLTASHSYNDRTTNLGVTGFGTTGLGQDQTGATIGLRHSFL
jgi:predicted porin